MPHAVGSIAGRKRKAAHLATQAHNRHTKSEQGDTDSDAQNSKDAILLLEDQIIQSRRNYNNIAKLLSICTETGKDDQSTTAAVALCRIFCRLTAAGDMTKKKGMPENEITIVNWLKARYAEYTEHLRGKITDLNDYEQGTALVLLMRLVKEAAGKDENVWRTGLFSDLLQAVLSSPQSSLAREELLEKYVEEYDDIRFFTLQGVSRLLDKTTAKDQIESGVLIDHTLEILTTTENLPQSSEEISNFFVESSLSKSGIRSANSHRKAAQDAWLAILRQPLTTSQRKTILNKVITHIAPILTHPELLMDFLTTSFDTGGATSLLALSGLFHLITSRNLDYPNFYQKLYSLVRADILHSKHRSRFFRLLNTFLSSTHLPATLVASFIKQLSRLALSAPPAGIVAVIPFVYNMLQRHRHCTFMLHREPHSAFLAWQKLSSNHDTAVLEDPFDADEPDPIKTNALESSLWELDTLHTHYHPNVATLSGIMAQQFTKREYQLEDFLDYSYATLLEAELSKEVQRPPVVEWEIPKRTFSAEDGGLGRMGQLLEKVRERQEVEG